MKTLHFEATADQRSALESLAYWIADIAYIRERYGDEEPELIHARDTVEKCCFPRLDRLGVPFWVQNSVSAWAGNWRRYKSEYMSEAMRKKGILLHS